MDTPQIRTSTYGKRSFTYATAYSGIACQTIVELNILFLILRVCFSPGWFELPLLSLQIVKICLCLLPVYTVKSGFSVHSYLSGGSETRLPHGPRLGSMFFSPNLSKFTLFGLALLNYIYFLLAADAC